MLLKRGDSLTSFTTSTIGASDIPHYTEGFCGNPGHACFYPLPNPLMYNCIHGAVRSNYANQHGITFYLWDYILEDWTNISFIIIPANSNDWHAYDVVFAEGMVSELLFYTSLPTTIDVDGFIDSTDTGAVIETISWYPRTNVLPGILTIVGSGSFKNYNAEPGYINFRLVDHPNTTSENTLYLDFLDIGAFETKTIGFNANSPSIPGQWPLGLKVWGDGESEPTWGSLGTAMLDLNIKKY
jgi:hypothetical protein